MFDGATQSWQDAWAQKQYNQSTLWSFAGLKWLEQGDLA
jgi:hypothetical protein